MLLIQLRWCGSVKWPVPKVGKYRELQHSGFYSRNWVELAEVIEDEPKEIPGTEDDC